MFRAHCSCPSIIENPSLRHQIRFAYKVHLYDCYNCRDIVRNLTSEEVFRVLSGDSPCNVFNVLHPSNLMGIDSDSFSYAEKFYFLTENAEVIDMFMEVPCGHCDVCRSDYVSSLRQRIMFALQETSTLPYFVTLTYDSDLVPRRGPDMRRLQLFKKKFKQTIKENYNYDSSLIKIIAVSENGHNKDGSDNTNLHYHLLLLGLPLFHPNNRTNFLILNHLLEFCWRLPEYEFSSDGKQSLNPISWSDYRKKYSLITRRPKGYDPFSLGYVHLRVVDSVSKTINYITKYITKDLNHPEKLPLYRVVDPLQLHNKKTIIFGQEYGDTKWVYVKGKFNSKGWRPHFLSVSQNLGLDFLRKLSIREDGSVAFTNWLDNTLYTVKLCGYYIHKLFPSFNVLVPPTIRRAYDNVLIEISRCLSSRYIDKPIKKMLLNTSIYVRNNFEFLGDFTIPTDSHFDFTSEYDFDTSLSLISKYTSVLYAFLIDNDIEDIKRRVLLLDKYYSLLVSHSPTPSRKPNPADVSALRKETATLRSKSIL